MRPLAEFLDMGGYAAFVWPAFGVTVLVLALLVADSMARLRRAQAGLAALDEGRTRRERPR